jgi:hypothetical protein
MLVLFSRSLGEAATAQVQGKLQGDQWKAVAGRLKEQNKGVNSWVLHVTG